MSARFDFSRGVFLFQRAPKPADWSTQEIANFYKVEHVLIQNGLAVEADRGLSDEGEPWFVFCHPNGDVFLHFARVDGGYLVAGPHIPQPLWNKDFSALLRSLQDRVPLVLPGSKGGNGATILMHPAVLLVATVAAFFYQSSNSAKADEQGDIAYGLNRENDARSAAARLTDLQAMTLMAAIVLMAGVQDVATLEDIRILLGVGDIAVSAEEGGHNQSDASMLDDAELVDFRDVEAGKPVAIEADRVDVASLIIEHTAGKVALPVDNPSLEAVFVSTDAKADAAKPVDSSRPLEEATAVATSRSDGIVEVSSEEKKTTATVESQPPASAPNASSEKTEPVSVPSKPAEKVAEVDNDVDDKATGNKEPVVEEGKAEVAEPPAVQLGYHVTYFNGMAVLHAKAPDDLPDDSGPDMTALDTTIDDAGAEITIVGTVVDTPPVV